MESISQKRLQFSDPFGRDPPPKAFYHPSRQKNLKKTEREITLSPDRPGAGSRKPPSRGDELFLKGTNAFSVQTPPHKDHSDEHSSQFDESWPSSERPSYTSVIDSETSSPVSGRASDMMDTLAYLKSTLERSEKHTHRLTQDTTAETRRDVSKGSVLQSYIERFRHGAPMSREERSQVDQSRKSELWWLSQNPPTPSDTSTPRDDDKPRSRQFTNQGKHSSDPTDHTKGLPLTKQTLRALSSVDDKTRKLQERADRLLEESTSSLHSSEPAVSTDGLGASTSGAGSSFEEIPYRPVFTRKQDTTHGHIDSHFSAGRDLRPLTSVPKRPLKPDEDILYQWRLRRKMEVAQQGQGPGVKVSTTYLTKDVDSKLDAFRRHLAGTPIPPSDVRSSAALHFTPAPVSASVNEEKRQADVEVQTRGSLESAGSSSSKDVRTPPRKKQPSKPEIASPTLSRHKQSRRTDPHLHLMCDLLPCPHAEKYSKLYQKSSDFSETDDSSSQQSHVQYKQYLQAEKPHSEEKRGKHKEKPQTSRKAQDYVSDENLSEDGLLQSEARKQTTSHGKTDNSDNLQGDNVSDMCENGSSDLDEQTGYQGRQLKQLKGKGGNFGVQDTDMKQVHFSDGRNLAREKVSSKSSLEDRKYQEREVERRVSKGRQSRDEGEFGNGTDTESKKTVTSKSGVPRPVHSSSPARQPESVTSAIGRTISEHLFDGSASAVISSVDSWASLTDHTQPPPSPPVHRPPVSHGQQERLANMVTDDQDSAGEVYDSDGDFPDDHILKMLRQQRAEYEIKLRQIDDLLQQSSFGQK